MSEEHRIAQLHGMLSTARTLAEENDPVLEEAMPRIVAILHDALRLVDLDAPESLHGQ